MSRRLFVLLAAIALLVAACGGGDDDVSVDGDADGTTTQLAEPSDDEGDDSEGDEGDEGDDESDDVFGDALDNATDAKVKVTYRVTNEGQDDQEFTIAQDPPKFALQADTGLLIDDGESFYTCDATEGGQCIELPREGSEGMTQNLLGAFAAPFLAFQNAAEGDISGYDVTGDEEIAGRDAVCATIDAGEIPGVTDSGSATSCVDKETGIMLRFEGEGTSDTGKIEAIEFGEPSDEDFEPTSEPMSIGG